MATADIGGIQLFHEVHGDGPIPLVLVHGGWGSHHDWDLIVAKLATSFTVVTYDRRGHGESGPIPEPGSMDDHIADAAALIEHLELAPAWVCGVSFGATIALRLAGAHPALLRGALAHDPTPFALLADDPSAAPMLEQNAAMLGTVVERIASGDHSGATEEFFGMALGPDGWQRLPPSIRQACVTNTPTFPHEVGDPARFAVDLDQLRAFSGPVLLSTGELSPPLFSRALSLVAEALPTAEMVTLGGAGHLPHLSHPEAYVASVGAFINSHTA